MKATEKLNMKVWLVDFTHTGQVCVRRSASGDRYVGRVRC